MSEIAIERQLLTSKEAAHMLGISERKLWGLTASGIVPCVWIDACKRYVLGELYRYIEGLQAAFASG